MNASKSGKILIVDDDPGHRITLKTITRSWGYAVETADDGETAVQRVKAEGVDLILMDVRMAGLSGIQALAQADVGLAIGTGTDVAIETADVILSSGSPGGIPRTSPSAAGPCVRCTRTWAWLLYTTSC